MKTKHLFLFLWSLLLQLSTNAQITQSAAQASIDSILPTNGSKTITAARLRFAFVKALNFSNPTNFGTGSITLPKLSITGATTGQVPTFNGSTVTWATPSGGGSITGLTTVANVTALRARVGTVDGEMVQTTGYYTRNDGGGWGYIWNASSTATDNGGNFIDANGAAAGVWELIYYGFVNAKCYGVKANLVNDDGPQLQKAINFIADKGGVLYLPNSIISTSVKLTVGTLSPSSNPYTETSFTIRGAGPPLNAGATDPIYTNGTSINYTGGAASTDAILEVRAGASRFVKLEDFGVTSTTIGAATYGILYSQTIFSQHSLTRVHSQHSTKSFGILTGGGTNGEFFTFTKCVFEGQTTAFYMDGTSGQSFDHSFKDCGMSVADGGTLIEIGGSGLGYSLNFDGLKSSNTWTAGSGLGVTLLKNHGSSGNINFRGGRLEAISTILNSDLGTFNMSSRIKFDGVEFDGMGSDNTHPFITSNNSGNSAFYGVNFYDCKFVNTYSAGTLKIDAGNGDASRYAFYDCDFVGFKSKALTTNLDERGGIIWERCNDVDPVTGVKTPFSKYLVYNDTDALTSRRFGSESIGTAYGRAENLLLQSNFGVNSGAALTPWVHGGTGSTFYEVRKIAYSGVDFHSPHAIQAILRATSDVSQNVAAAPFDQSVNTYYYQAVVSTAFQTGGQIKFSLENSVTNRVYESVTITGGVKYNTPMVVTLKATDGNVGGVLRLRIQNLRADLGILNLDYHFVSKSPDATFVPTTTTAITNSYAYDLNSNTARIFGRFKLPAKTDETGSASSTITDLDNDATADMYVSTTTGRLKVRIGGKWLEFPASDYGSAAPTTGTWPRGWIRYNDAPTAGGVFAWECVTAGTPGTWKVVSTIAP